MSVASPASFLAECAAYLPRQRVETLLHPDRPAPRDGVALIADISGFTPLTEALARGLRADQGAEELTRALNGVFTPLIDEIHAYRGSVLKFAGDALLVWYGRERGLSRAGVIRRALTSALRMQKAMAAHGQIETPIGPIVLQMKIGLTYGPVHWFSVGAPDIGLEDVLVGATLDRMAEAEHHAQPGAIVADEATARHLPPDALALAPLHGGFVAVRALHRPAEPKPWPRLRWPAEGDPALADALRSYVPQQIAQTLVSGRVHVAELKPVVSLFVQFHGLDYDHDAQVFERLQTYFAAVQQIVQQYGGRLNRLITGDKGSVLHIIFGAPQTVEEQEARAVACALAVQAEGTRLPFITMQRIGMAAGRVFAGPLGSPVRHDYTTMGDAINLSARLMQNAAPHQILMDAGVHSRLGARFDVADLAALRVKGKAESVAVYAALGQWEGRADGPRAAQRTAMVGRAAELAVMAQRLADARAGRGGVVVLTGDVGMGKSLMLQTARAELAHGVSWADGAGLAYGQTLSGYVLIAALRDLMQLPVGAGPEAARARLAEFCADLFGPARAESKWPYLASFMGLPLMGRAAGRVEGLSAENVRWQIQDVLAETLQRLAARAPLVLALDDVQWADGTSLQMLEALAPELVRAGVLLVLTLRPERQSAAWVILRRLRAALAGAVTDIELGALDAQAAARLVTQLAPSLPQRIVDHLVQKGGGNPLFLTEMVHTLQAAGWLADADALDALSLADLGLPDSVQGLLLAQIDRLAVGARHALQMASVIGTEFLYRVLAALAEDEARLNDHLATLQATDYVRPGQQADMGPAYAFRHGLIQESAYSTLLYERRRAYHLGVARALERFFPTLIGEQCGILAHHYERANVMEQAIIYYQHTADRARLLYAHNEAERLYHRVLDLLEQDERGGARHDEERHARLWLKLAQVRANALDFEGAQVYYERAFALLEQVERARPPAAASGAPRIFRAGVAEDGPPTLDPGLCPYSDYAVLTGDLFEGLLELDDELNVVPAVALRWQVDRGGTRYRFQLQRGLRWSDGRPLTAHDFVFAWRRNLHPATDAPAAHLMFLIRGAEAFHRGEVSDPTSVAVRAVDDYQLEVDLTAAAPFFPFLLVNAVFFPQPAHAVEALADAWAEPENVVGNGAFQVREWRQGDAIVLAQNPHYGGHRLGNVEQVVLRFVKPNLDGYATGLVDWCLIEERTEAATSYMDDALLMLPLTTFFLAFAAGEAPLSDPRVRRALAHSIDRDALVQQDSGGIQRAAHGGVVPPGVPGHSPEAGLPFDPALARALLAEAGYPGGRGFPVLTLGASIGYQSVPAFLRDSWRTHLGIAAVASAEMPMDELLAGLEARQLHMALLGYEMDYPDPDAILRLYFHSAAEVYRHYLGWSDARFDRLVDQAAQTADATARLALYHQADRFLVADAAAVVPLYYWRMHGVLRPAFSLPSAGKIVRGKSVRFKNIVAL